MGLQSRYQWGPGGGDHSKAYLGLGPTSKVFHSHTWLTGVGYSWEAQVLSTRTSHGLPECPHNMVAGSPPNERFKALKSHRLVLLLYSVVTQTSPNLVWEGVLLGEYQEILGGTVYWGHHGGWPPHSHTEPWATYYQNV